MHWTKELVKLFCDQYYSLRDYEVNPFQELDVWYGEAYFHGRGEYNSPQDELMDMNWEFEEALKKLGDREQEFRDKYIDGISRRNSNLYKEFVAYLLNLSE